MKFQLSDICDYVKGKISVSSLNERTYVSTENMLPNKAGIANAASLPTAMQTQAFFAGDVLVSNIRPYFKKIWFAEFDGGCSNDVLVFRAKEGVNKRFLYYVLADDAFFDYTMATSKGTKMPRGDKTAIMKYEVPVFTYEEQGRIARILSLLDDKSRLNMAINKNLLQQAKEIYNAWFCDSALNDRSTNWPNTTIDDITSLVVRGIAPKYEDDTDQVVINQKCIRNHMIDLTPARHHLPKRITEKWLLQGDLLINSTGEGTLGRVAQVWFIPYNLTVDSHVTIVRPKTPKLRNYIGLWGITHEAEIEALHTGSTGQTELPRERVKAMELPLPDEYTLSEFNRLITPITQSIVDNQRESVLLAKLRDTILPKLMSGEIDVSNLNL